MHLLVLPLPLLTRIDLLVHPVAPSQRELGRLKGLPSLPEEIAIGVVRRGGRRPTRQKKKTRTIGVSQACPADPRAVQSRLHHQQVAGRKRRAGNRWSHSGMKETDSGEQDASTRHASGEAWQKQVCGAFPEQV
ncbi:hypothetical protein NDU88_002948 [Pleurodeles waltl]|uniref:Uncharacterized protein n=1 Tax=Pleurodeles waltl TaxID=8319 RepID=A0AAV7VFY0_PLEWA|nr:hypothetical protein NDU88_002948 [Pleurodeles waltl]